MLRQLWPRKNIDLWKDSSSGPESLLPEGGKLLRCTADNAELDVVKQKHIIYVDDIGTENLSVKYGEKRLAFAELADEAEKKGKLLILTTNLSIDELREKYGERTIDRLRAITRTVLFSGESLRI